MTDIYDRLKELNITLPPPPTKGGVYTPAICFGDHLMYCSGCGPAIGGETFVGKLGLNLSVDEGRQAARNCLLNLLANIEAEVKSLRRVRRFAKMLAFVASADNFYLQPMVANGASELLADIFGPDVGCPARSAIGVNVLPGNISVEIEMLVELR